VEDLPGVSEVVEEMRAATGSSTFSATVQMSCPLGSWSRPRHIPTPETMPDAVAAVREKGVTIAASWRPLSLEKLAPLCPPSATDCSAQMVFNGGDKSSWGPAVLASHRRLKRLAALCRTHEGGEWPVPNAKHHGALFDRVGLFMEEEKLESNSQQKGEADRFGEATMAWNGSAETTAAAVTGVFGEPIEGDHTSGSGTQLQERVQLDVTDRLSVFLEGSTDLVDLTDTLDAVLEALKKGDLTATVSKDNKTQLGNFVRAAGRLSHQRSRNQDVSEAETALHATMETLLAAPLPAVLEITIHRASRDYAWWLLHDNAAASAQLEWFLEKEIPVAVQACRLEALQATVELLSAARAVHTPWERLQSLLTTSLAHHRREVESCAVRPNFVMPLPPFVRSSSSLLAHLADGPAATSWMLHLQNAAGASRVALLLQHSLLDPEASEDLDLPKEMLPEGVELDFMPKQGLLKAEPAVNPLDVKYVTYLGRCDQWRWSAVA